MNIKYLLLTLSLLPTPSLADTPAQPTEKTTMQKVNDFVTWRKVAMATGVASLVSIFGGLGGAGFAYFKLNGVAKEYLISNLSLQKIDTANLNIDELTTKFIDKMTAAATADKVFKIAIQTATELKKVEIPPLKSDSFLKYQKRGSNMLGVIGVGSLLALTCLGTLTYALIKKLTSKNEAEQKSANAAIA